MPDAESETPKRSRVDASGPDMCSPLSVSSVCTPQSAVMVCLALYVILYRSFPMASHVYIYIYTHGSGLS